MPVITVAEGDTRGRRSAEAMAHALAAVTARDADGIANAASVEVVDDFVAVDVFRGREEVRRYFRELFAAVPDLDFRVLTITAVGPIATGQWEATGTFTGAAYQGIAPTGRRVRLVGVDVMEFDDDDRFCRNTVYFDGLAFARQVGLLPAKDSRADRAVLRAFNLLQAARARLHQR